MRKYIVIKEINLTQWYTSSMYMHLCVPVNNVHVWVYVSVRMCLHVCICVSIMYMYLCSDVCVYVCISEQKHKRTMFSIIMLHKLYYSLA